MLEINDKIKELLSAIGQLDDKIKNKILLNCNLTEGDFYDLTINCGQSDEDYYQDLKERIDNGWFDRFERGDRIELIQSMLQVERDLA